MKVSELTKELKKHGCQLVAQGGEHEKWYSPITKKYFRVPRHPAQELKKGTAEKIKKDAGLK